MIANGRDIDLERDEDPRALALIMRGIRIHAVKRSPHVRPSTYAVRHMRAIRALLRRCKRSGGMD